MRTNRTEPRFLVAFYDLNPPGVLASSRLSSSTSALGRRLRLLSRRGYRRPGLAHSAIVEMASAQLGTLSKTGDSYFCAGR